MAELTIIRTVEVEPTAVDSNDGFDLTTGVITVTFVSDNKVMIVDDSNDETVFISHNINEIEDFLPEDQMEEQYGFENFLEKIRGGVVKVPKCLSVDEEDTHQDEVTTLFSLFLIWRLMDRKVKGKHTVSYHDYTVKANDHPVGTLSHISIDNMMPRFVELATQVN